MHKLIFPAVALFILLFAYAGAAEHEEQYPEGKIKLFGKRYSLAVRLGFAELSNSGTKDVFGGGSLSPGVSLFRPIFKEGASFDYDLAWHRYKEDGNKAMAIGATAGMKYIFVDPVEEKIVPYFKIHAGPYWTKTTGNESEIVAGANASLGVEINDRVTFSVRYDWIDERNGFDLSRWSVGVGVKVW